MPQLIDISDEVTPKFFDAFKKGQVLGFQKDGVLTRYKIVRFDKRRKIVKVREVKLYTEQEAKDYLDERR